MSVYLRFEDAGTSASGKTRVWVVRSATQGTVLGKVAWYGPWRQYVFTPAQGTLYSAGCLEDIRAFITGAMVK